jgi:protein TonB
MEALMKLLILSIACVLVVLQPCAAQAQGRKSADAEFVEDLLGPWFPYAWRTLETSFPEGVVNWKEVRNASSEKALKEELAALWGKRFRLGDVQVMVRYLKGREGSQLLEDYYALLGDDGPLDEARSQEMKDIRSILSGGLWVAIRASSPDSLTYAFTDIMRRIVSWKSEVIAAATSSASLSKLEEAAVLRRLSLAPPPIEVCGSEDPFVVPVECEPAKPAEGSDWGVPPEPLETVAPKIRDWQDAVDVTVYVEVTIDTEGNVSEARLVKAIAKRGADVEPITSAVLRAVRKWKFKPAFKDGAPVECRIQLPFEVSLRDE